MVVLLDVVEFIVVVKRMAFVEGGRVVVVEGV